MLPAVEGVTGPGATAGGLWHMREAQARQGSFDGLSSARSCWVLLGSPLVPRRPRQRTGRPLIECPLARAIVGGQRVGSIPKRGVPLDGRRRLEGPGRLQRNRAQGQHWHRALGRTSGAVRGLSAARTFAVLPLFCLVVGGSSPWERRAGPGREGTPRGRSNGGCCRSHIRAERGWGSRLRQMTDRLAHTNLFPERLHCKSSGAECLAHVRQRARR